MEHQVGRLDSNDLLETRDVPRCKLNLRVCRVDIEEALGIDKRQMLLLPILQPKQEVREEVRRLEKAQPSQR